MAKEMRMTKAMRKVRKKPIPTKLMKGSGMIKLDGEIIYNNPLEAVLTHHGYIK